MNDSQIALFIIVLLVGLVALRWARLFGKKQKAHYEDEATKRIERDLESVQNDISNYVIYRYIKLSIWGKQHIWGKSNYTDMKNEILQNCTKTSGRNGDLYSTALYSLYINTKIKKIYYVVGISGYDFSDVK